MRLFQGLTPRQRPANKEPAKIQSIGKSRSLIKAFNLPTIRKALSKLKSNKACGPDGIPNEAIRGITVNNSLSKLCASLLNDRLSKFVETRGGKLG
jgi:hypothetical protein